MLAKRGFRKFRNIELNKAKKKKKKVHPEEPSYNSAAWLLAGHVPLYLD